MHPKSAFRFILPAFLCLPFYLLGQKSLTAKSPEPFKPDSVASMSNVVSFKSTGEQPDTSKATLHVRVLEKGQNPVPVQGATVLLRRDKDKMLGRVTRHDGRCSFSFTPASYTVRVQMTGLKTVEKSGFILEAGKDYDMEILMSRN